MDATTLQNIEAEISAGVATAAQIAEVVAPQYAGFIVLGQAVAAAVPALMDDVEALISGTPPTAAQVTALAQKVAALQAPQNL